MGVISTAMATWRTALAAAPASLTNLPENITIEDAPDTDRAYFAVLAGDSGGGSLAPEHGAGTLYGDFTVIRVAVSWVLDIDQEAHSATIMDDIQNVQTVMLDQTNKGTSVVLIEPLGWTLDSHEWGTLGTLRYQVRFRVTADLS